MTVVQNEAIKIVDSMIKDCMNDIVNAEAKVDALQYLKGLVYGDEEVEENV